MMGLLRFEDAEVNTEINFNIVVNQLRWLTAMFFTPDGCTVVT